ncbi:MAG: chorismate-binding protein [Acidobacteriota bacterium]|nr:chorismate-binding protein [Acidobacteriota bacterium]
MSPARVTAHQREFLADRLTPVGVYRRLARRSPVRFLFESVTGGEQVSRYSFLGAGPRVIYRLFPDRLEVERVGEHRGAEAQLEGDPLEALRCVLGAFRSDPGLLPFQGGFVGFFGFDLVRLIENLPSRPPDPFDLPIAWLGRFDEVIVFDHARQSVVALANEIEGEVSAAESIAALDELSTLLTRGETGGGVEVPPTSGDAGSSSPQMKGLGESVGLSGKDYRAAVEQVKEYIRDGDIFQAVIARRWVLDPGESGSTPGSTIEPLALYRAARTVNPSPYMVLLEAPEVALVGTSPEMLVRKQGNRIETRPIAGTRPRGENPAADRALASELSADEKERAEHLMLVDLGRNDLGRVAVTGSVEVTDFMEVERYSHVMHLESSVEARLDEGHNALDALLACFPAGTVSGAPKIRAIEIIDELESEARGPYAGAVGYLSHTGDLDACITIRTLVLRGGEISLTAGAGIVADSVPELEQRETENKAAALLAAVELALRLAESE